MSAYFLGKDADEKLKNRKEIATSASSNDGRQSPLDKGDPEAELINTAVGKWRFLFEIFLTVALKAEISNLH